MTTSDLQAYADARATLYAIHPELPDDTILMMLAQAWAESRFGRQDANLGLAGTNNWGSMQVTSGWAKAHGNDAGYGGLSYTDTSPKTGHTVSYQAQLRVYPSQRIAATDFANAVRSYVGPLEQLNGQDVYTYAYRLYGWYEGQVVKDPTAPGGYRKPTHAEAAQQYTNMVGGALSYLKKLEAQRAAQGLAGSPDVARGEPFSRPERVHLFAGESAGGDASPGPFSSGSQPCAQEVSISTLDAEAAAEDDNPYKDA